MALCREPRVPVSHCGFLLVLHTSQLELQMAAECDRVVFVLFVATFDKCPTVRSLDLKRFVNEISACITPSLTFEHQMRSHLHFRTGFKHRALKALFTSCTFVHVRELICDEISSCSCYASCVVSLSSKLYELKVLFVNNKIHGVLDPWGSDFLRLVVGEKEFTKVLRYFLVQLLKSIFPVKK